MTNSEVLLALSNMLEPINNKIQTIQDTIQNMQCDIQDIKNRIKKVEITQETIILPRLQTIESCYTSTFKRYKNNVDDYEILKQDVSVLKKVVTKHSEKLQHIS